MKNKNTIQHKVNKRASNLQTLRDLINLKISIVSFRINNKIIYNSIIASQRIESYY